MAHRVLVLAEVLRNLWGKGKRGLTLFKKNDHRLDRIKRDSWQCLCKPTMSDASIELEARKPLPRGRNVVQVVKTNVYERRPSIVVR